jgi:protein-disulfide isomerase
MSKQARTRTQELQKAQKEAARRQAQRLRVFAWVGGLVVLALVAAIVVVVVRAVGGEDEPKPTGRVVVPANVDPPGSIPVGDDGAPVTVAVYYDYMCPACGAFEAANGSELERLVEAGDARVELRPISFLDEQSNGTEYSTRTANAVATVADGAPERVWSLHAALYDAQPEEGTSGLSDEQIADIATDAGVPADVVDRFDDRTFEPWVASVTDAAFESGVTGTPTVHIDGEPFEGDLYTPGALTEAVEAAAGAR